jgi:hypothetical protein
MAHWNVVSRWSRRLAFAFVTPRSTRRDRRIRATRFPFTVRLLEGRGRPVRPRLFAHLWSADRRLPHVVHLWSAPVR